MTAVELVHDLLRTMLASFQELKQQSSRNENWRKTAENGCEAVENLLAITDAPEFPPSLPPLSDSTRGHFDCIYTRLRTLTRNSAPFIHLLAKDDPLTAIEYCRRLWYILDSLNTLKSLEHDDRQNDRH